MKAERFVLTIAVLTATAGANFLEFNEDTFKSLRLTDLEGVSSEASVINFDSGIEFRLKKKLPNEVEFEEQSLSYRSPWAEENPTCGYYPGVCIDEVCQIYSRIRTLTVKVDENDRGQQFIEFLLFMDSDETGPFVLKVPALKDPPGMDLLDAPEFREWMDTHRVGLASPLRRDELTSAGDTGSFVISFSWLYFLLEHEVFKSSTPIIGTETGVELKTYVTWPVIMAEDDMKACVEMIAVLNNATGLGKGSNAPGSSDADSDKPRKKRRKYGESSKQIAEKRTRTS